VAAVLEETAADARRRSGVGVGAHLLQRAARLTRNDARRRLLLRRAAEDFARAGAFSNAEWVLADPALASATDPPTRAAAAAIRAGVKRLRGHLQAAHDLLDAEASMLADSNPRLASALLLEAAISVLNLNKHRGLAVATSAVALDREAVIPRLVAGSLRSFLGESAPPSEAEIDEGLEAIEATPDSLSAPEHLIFGPAWALTQRGEHDRVADVFDRWVERLTAQSADGLLPIVLCVRGQEHYTTGRWIESLGDLTDGVRVADEAGLAFEAAASLPWLARLEAVVGREVECREHLARARIELAQLGIEYEQYLGAHARLLELTLDRPERALEYAIDPRERRSAANWVEAAIRVGRIAEARSALDELDRRSLEDATMRPAVLRCRGLLAGDDDYEMWFADAIEADSANAVDAFERARTQLLLGERRRRSGQRVRSREPLASALAVFERLGAHPWAERARRELRSTGMRARSETLPGLEVLTAQELAVARAVADGATNRDVAAALFLSVKTVEFHLANAYRKLDARSRSDLTRIVVRATAA
jgi:DNA-binding CsgD family transcriptional regulator